MRRLNRSLLAGQIGVFAGLATAPPPTEPAPDPEPDPGPTSPVDGMTVTRTHVSGPFNAYATNERQQPIVFRAPSVTIPSGAGTYLLMEMGATGIGCGVWYQDGNLRMRAGSGSAGTPNTDYVYVDTAVTQGAVMDITWEFDPAANTARLWYDNTLVITATASPGYPEWAGGDNAGYGSTNSSLAVSVPSTPWPTASSPLEAYINQRVV